MYQHSAFYRFLGCLEEIVRDSLIYQTALKIKAYTKNSFIDKMFMKPDRHIDVYSNSVVLKWLIDISLRFFIYIAKKFQSFYDKKIKSRS